MYLYSKIKNLRGFGKLFKTEVIHLLPKNYFGIQLLCMV